MLPEAIVEFAGTDETCMVLSATIRHGRDDPSSQPEGDSVTMELVGAIPAGVDIGTTVTLSAVYATVTYPRFVGRLTDLHIGWDTPDTPVATVIAIGAVATMGRRIVGDAPWPAELDGARANRVIGLAGVPTDAARTDPGLLTVLARDVDAQPALIVALDAAADGGGLLWQARDGVVLYADAAHRRGATTALALDACDLPIELSWSKGLEGLCNDVHIRYGVAPEGGAQPEIHVSEPISIAERGIFGASITTRLADMAAAQQRADEMLARQAMPAWVVSGVGLSLAALPIAKVPDVLAIEIHDLVSVTGLPAGSPETSALLWVEGWTERILPESWQIELSVTDYCRTAPAPYWDDVDPAWTWDALDPTLTWDGATCLPPRPPQGRWDDVPASLRWDQVAPATTWDTWT